MPSFSGHHQACSNHNPCAHSLSSIDSIVRLPYKRAMGDEKMRFNQMLEALMAFVDAINASHSKGVRFGTDIRIHPAEIHTIAAIGMNQGVSLTRLAENLKISKPTLSERIKILVGKGLVEKRKNPEDRKAVTLWLTPEGKKADQHHTLHHEELYATFRQYFGEESSQKIDLFTRSFQELMLFGKDADGHD
ncbi:hypothetical protein DQK91_13815 [Oceanidesulfovibrio marinus]|uniref:HTH marR-type domain-containing protein n=2 Tax=Oceanidesulfovibrio marinus TaxID=370038 RepID=A0A6P1ZE01_9BACT|nr:hypothetical protein DQK91_13815 [Oceanidesulfovibrio marinus]